MAQSINIATRQSILNYDSPLIKMISCIPYVGIISSLYAVQAVRDENRATFNANPIKNVETSREYKFIDLMRNLISAILIVSVVALGILSGPTGMMMGLILATGHAACALWNQREIREINETLYNLRNIAQQNH